MALNYINKGLFCSPKIKLSNRSLFIKYKVILVGCIVLIVVRGAQAYFSTNSPYFGKNNITWVMGF